MTHECAEFYAELQSIFNFFTRLVAHTLKPAILEGMTEVPAKPSPALRQFVHDHSELIVHMLYARSVDNFLTYVADLLGLVASRPDAGSGSKPVASTRDAAKKIERLSRRGWEPISAYFRKELEFTLFPDEKHEQMLRSFVAVRNLIVHNRGYVDERFVEQFAGAPWKLGEQIPIGATGMITALELFWRTVDDVDSRAAKAFGLERTHRRADVAKLVRRPGAPIPELR
jgi:hypothetical protein